MVSGLFCWLLIKIGVNEVTYLKERRCGTTEINGYWDGSCCQNDFFSVKEKTFFNRNLAILFYLGKIMSMYFH